MAGRLKCFIQPSSHRQARQFEAARVGFFTGQVNVLHQMPHQKARGEVTSQCPRGQIRQAPTARGTAADDLLNCGSIKATGLGGGQGLTPGHHANGNGDLIGELATLATAGRPQPGDRLAQQLKQWAGSFKGRLIATRHDHECGVAGPNVTAGDRCIDRR